MPIQNASDSQKVDFLWKKIVYGAAKTDISGNIDATQEPVASPLQIRADKILQNSDQIPTVIPGSNSSVVTVYPTTFPVECISTSGIPTPTLTWQTGRTFWVPPEFGSTYQIKVYIAPSGNAANVASKGIQVFATGSGYNDLWVFDYQAGILNFNSNNTPYNGASPISFTGNSVYISGAVYAGAFGLPDSANIGNLILGNIIFNGNTISSNQTNGNIVLDPPGTGIVQLLGTSAVGLPSGGDATRPTYAEIGYTRFNTDRGTIETWNGTAWAGTSDFTITSDVITPDGVSNVYTLSSNASTSGVLVNINGTIQQPTSAYTIVNNNQIQFTEIPLTTDIIEVRHIAVGAVSIDSLSSGNTSITLDQVTNSIKFVTDNTEHLRINSTGATVGLTANVFVNVGNTVIIDSYDKNIYRTAKYLVQATSSLNVESYEALVTHNANASAFITVYGVINTGVVLGNISAVILGSNVQVQYAATSANTNVRLSKNYLLI